MVPRRVAIAACALLLATPFGVAACGNDEKLGVDSPASEGLSLPLDGVNYDVLITRELNPKITADDAYVSKDAPPGQALYGVFLRACNASKSARDTASTFVVRDNQNNTFRPEPMPADNQFAYTSRRLDQHECIPEAGSVAQLGPTAGSMLLFRLPLANTENRPLELEIQSPVSGKKLTYDLDI